MGTIEVGELLYEYRANVTGIAEYGVSFEALIGGKVPPPAEGARFDVCFAGPAKGSRLNGRVTGVDYLRVRADGRFDLVFTVFAEPHVANHQLWKYQPRFAAEGEASELTHGIRDIYRATDRQLGLILERLAF